MNPGAIAFVLIAVGYFALELFAMSRMKYRTEPLYIYEEYVTADTAAMRCSDPDSAERSDFLRNFGAVRRRAAKHLAQENPNVTSAEIATRLDSLKAARSREVIRIIDARNCSDSEVWRWAKLHEVRARLNLR